MTPLSSRVATTRRELDDALRTRWAVFGAELGLLGSTPPPAPREVNCFDTLETTVHVIVYAGAEPVATSRLLLPNPEVARASGGAWGIDLERKLDLSGVGGPGLVFAETTRLCILESWRHSEVLPWLLAGLYRESRRAGVTHWIASANTDTDRAEDARIVAQVARHQGLMSPRWHVRARAALPLPEVSSAPLYTEEERARARRGRLAGLRLPHVPRLLARKMGARFIADPLYDAGFHRFSLPLVAALDDIPARTLQQLSALGALAS